MTNIKNTKLYISTINKINLNSADVLVGKNAIRTVCVNGKINRIYPM